MTGHSVMPTKAGNQTTIHSNHVETYLDPGLRWDDVL